MEPSVQFVFFLATHSFVEHAPDQYSQSCLHSMTSLAAHLQPPVHFELKDNLMKFDSNVVHSKYLNVLIQNEIVIENGM